MPAHHASRVITARCAATCAALCTATFIAALPAQAQGLPPIAANCQPCHGIDGTSGAADIPNLAGQRRAYLEAQLRAFRAGSRKSELMNAVAAQLRDEDIGALAAWWSSRPLGRVGMAAAIPSRMAFPVGFPQGFREYRREDDAASRSVTVSWANAPAWAAAAAGQPLPDGSIVIVASHAAEADANGALKRDAQGRLVAGPAQSYSGMQAQAGWGAEVPPLLRNGNWHYALFSAAGEPRGGALHPRCLACHQPQAANSHVFGLGMLQAAARRP